MNGRGAYVCAADACIAQAERQKRLERSLRTSSISADVFNELKAAASSMQEPSNEAVVPAGVDEPHQRIMDKENKV